MFKKITICLLMLSTICSLAQETKEIKWEDLIPSGLEFEDPFLKLSDEQLFDLRYVYRTRLLLKTKPETVSEKTKTKTDSLEQKLLADGVDIDYLISQKNSIRDKRQKLAESVVQELNGKNIRLAGFLLPLEMSFKEVTEFLFVPYIGACIHQPSPPKNQIIYFEYPDGYKVSSRYDPAWIEGELLIQETKNTLMLVDGTDQIESGYYLKVKSIEPFYNN